MQEGDGKKLKAIDGDDKGAGAQDGDGGWKSFGQINSRLALFCCLFISFHCIDRMRPRRTNKSLLCGPEFNFHMLMNNFQIFKFSKT